MMGRGAAAVFSFQLLGLIRADEREAHGEVGRLDGDPICDCQDAGGLALTGLDIQLAPHGRAAAHVTLHYPSPEVRKLTLQLLWTPHGWLVDDVSTAETPSLRQLLQTPLH
jgi:hypothetical protein